MPDSLAPITQTADAAEAQWRERLLNDLHDGLGARLLQLRLCLGQLSTAEVARQLDECLLEMRLSVDALSEAEGELGVLLGGWRQRVEPAVRAAGLLMQWQVRSSPRLSCLRGSGALELVRWQQEALSNALRHAHAQQLTVATETRGRRVTLWFADDGIGLPQQACAGQGRRSLQARAQRLGAELTWHSPAPRALVAQGRGTALELRFAA